MQADKPKATTPFHAASDMVYFEDLTVSPPQKKKKKKEDPLAKILVDVGFESEPEPESEASSPSPPPLEELFKTSQHRTSLAAKKVKKPKTFSSNVRGTGGARHHHGDIPDSRSTKPEDLRRSSFEDKAPPNLAADETQSKTHAVPRAGKRKAHDIAVSEQQVDSHPQSKRKSQRSRSQKIQTGDSQQPSRPNVYSTQLDRRQEATDGPPTDRTSQVQEVIVIDEDEAVEECQGDAMGSTPPSRSQHQHPAAGDDLNQEHRQDGFIDEAAEVSSDHGYTNARPPVQAGQKASCAAMASDGLPAEPLEDEFGPSNEQSLPEKKGRGPLLSHRVYGRTVSTRSSDEPLLSASGQTSSSTGSQNVKLIPSVGNKLGHGLGYRAAHPSLLEQKHASHSHVPPQDNRLDYSASSSLGSLFSNHSGQDSIIPHIRINFEAPHNTRHSAPEAVWKEAIVDDSPPAVLQNIVSVRFRTTFIKKLMLLTGTAQ
jgi:hypothetical protein